MWLLLVNVYAYEPSKYISVRRLIPYLIYSTDTVLYMNVLTSIKIIRYSLLVLVVRLSHNNTFIF